MNSAKQPLFSIDERVSLIRDSIGNDPRIDVRKFDGLLVDFAREVGATLSIRGLRAVADFEYEYQMALMNRHLNADLETVFMVPSIDRTYVSSSIVREVAKYGGDTSGLVHPVVDAALRARFNRCRAASRDAAPMHTRWTEICTDGARFGRRRLSYALRAQRRHYDATWRASHRHCHGERVQNSTGERDMSFSIKKQGEIVVVDVEGQLIVGNRQELKQRVLDELEKGESKFLIDFSQTGYIDSSGLGVLVSLSKKIREQGGELRLANLNDDLKTLFELTKLDTLFQISDTRERALETF